MYARGQDPDRSAEVAVFLARFRPATHGPMNADRLTHKRRRDRILKTAGGFALLTLGVPMLFLPGPGGPAIVLGLSMLESEYVWAHKALGHFGRPTKWLRSTLQPSLAWAQTSLARMRVKPATRRVQGSSAPRHSA